MTPDPPIACTLSADELRTKRGDLLPGLAERAIARERVEGGVRLQFAAAPDIVRTIAGVIDAERQCCRFLHFTLAIDADLGPVSLTVTAPPAAQEILTRLLES